MKTEKLLKVSSIDYDKAESAAFFNAVVAPVLVAISLFFLGDIDVFISGLSCTLLLSAINLHRSFSNDPFLEEKSKMYFQHLRYLFVFCFFAWLCMHIGVSNV